jgi:hypothetical protein
VRATGSIATPTGGTVRELAEPTSSREPGAHLAAAAHVLHRSGDTALLVSADGIGIVDLADGCGWSPALPVGVAPRPGPAVQPRAGHVPARPELTRGT